MVKVSHLCYSLKAFEKKLTNCVLIDWQLYNLSKTVKFFLYNLSLDRW